MSEFLREHGHSPLLYWLVAVASLLLLLGAAFPAAPASGRWRALGQSPLVFGALLLFAMLAWRWPAAFYFKAVNPDEPQFLAGALTLLAHGRFWWTDPTTSGPLVVLPLTLPGLLGLPVDYRTGRVVALLLEWSQVFLAYLALRHVHGERWARLLVLPLAGVMTFLLFWDFVPYCSELAPLFLCALAAWLCLTAFSTDGRLLSRWRLAGGGLVLGLMPFSKFQVLPLGAAIGVSALAWCWWQPERDGKQRLATLGWLLGGVAAGAGLLLASLWQSGLASDVYKSYFLHNLHYAQARALPWSASGYILRHLTETAWGFAAFHYGILLVLLLSLPALKRTAWRPLLLGWLLALAAYGAVLTPGRLYPHYLFFLTLPLALLAGLQFGYLLSGPALAMRRSAGLWIVVLVGVGFLPQFIERIRDRQSLQRLVPPVSPRASLTAFINEVKRPGDALAIWGWRPEIYVETQLPQATREAHTNGQLIDSPLQDYFRARFLDDLRTTRPAFFVDAVGPEDFGHPDRGRDGHETFPALAEYIRQEYAGVNPAAAIRLYVRRDLLTQ